MTICRRLLQKGSSRETSYSCEETALSSPLENVPKITSINEATQVGLCVCTHVFHGLQHFQRLCKVPEEMLGLFYKAKWEATNGKYSLPGVTQL